ncbi:sugar phosphate isomerase/epimerase [Dyadobacter chenwenxiniae]|uniref:Sugar phosphate isomerase/epimerase n=1 Tax=Dyadobacter chenwenxiniae TaxID=2906456 RepID=A0A9X1TD84_9BACT|nr:sugar phosphate isomerase/epimerase family protein [Dyadobacter chenwenxiniae]MCF0061646.1 sugar phosphate isomerase/epimerase [Dyadobacter chenwenxiniae]UON81467.1 sugar phosphate isomerase/epimerase [Dyadobacter chenwenxiniae]
MKYSMNLLLWGPQIDDSLFPTLELIKEIGFDGVEVPIFNTNPAHWFNFRKKLDELGLACETDTICGPSEHLISPDPAMRRHTIDHLKSALDCSLVLGATKLMGPYHSALGVFTGQPATPEEWQWAIEGIREVADYAESLDITLGLEYLNRFELYLTSCGDELIRFVDEVNHPHCKIMFDTFHANIEEKNIGDTMRKAGDRISFIQLSENDRSTPGKGNVDWEGVFKAIKDIRYDGWISIEAFSQKLPVANIWRKMFESEEQLMRDGLAFIKSNLS